jgi:hypothetical protein
MKKLRVPMEAEMLTKALMVGHAKGEMPPDMRVMPMDPIVKSMGAAEREFTTGEGWRRSQHHHQERDEQQPSMSCHNSSALPMFVTSLRRDRLVDPRALQQADVRLAIRAAKRWRLKLERAAQSLGRMPSRRQLARVVRRGPQRIRHSRLHEPMLKRAVRLANRSRSCQSVTFAPTASTMPAASKPGIVGSCWSLRYIPLRSMMSA